MKIIAIHVQKGGSGKTTTAGNLGHGLSKYGKTLLVDCDPQGNLSSWLSTGPMSYDLADVLQGKASIQEATVNICGNLDLIPTFAIDGTLKRWAESSPVAFDRGFSALAKDLEVMKYDYLVLDCSPGMSAMERSIVAVADEILPVVKAEFFSVDGLEIFEAELVRIRQEYRVQISAPRVVLNMVDERIGLHTQYRKTLDGMGYRLFTVHSSARVAECPTFHTSIFSHEPDGRAAQEFQLLTEAVQ